MRVPLVPPHRVNVHAVMAREWHEDFSDPGRESRRRRAAQFVTDPLPGNRRVGEASRRPLRPRAQIAVLAFATTTALAALCAGSMPPVALV
jgi:hypothetical protein